jgi:hypothetical protein
MALKGQKTVVSDAKVPDAISGRTPSIAKRPPGGDACQKIKPVPIAGGIGFTEQISERQRGSPWRASALR